MLAAAVWIAALLCGGIAVHRSRPFAPAGTAGPDWGELLLGLSVVLLLAGLTRTLWLNRIPQGTYIDEIFTLRNTLRVMERPFDLFGQTPLINDGWVETSNLYLNFNALIIRLFGVSYLTVKLFSAIPGIMACGFFYLASRRLFPARVALFVTLLLVFAHWHIRLSRYGWDASFLVMTLAAAVWLTLESLNERPLIAYFAGVAAGIGLYSYVAGRLCFLAIGGYLALIALRARQKSDVQRLLAFAVGAGITIAPLLVYYVLHQQSTWIRVGELSIFSTAHPLSLFLHNVWGHALMFNVHGGAYARDNYPGLPMLDILTGLLFLVGVANIAWRRRERAEIFLFVLLAATLLGGILSTSQEGAPYVYRASAAIVPTLLIAGIGLQTLLQEIGSLPRLNAVRGLASAMAIGVITVVAALNYYAYFVLERQDVSAMRIMGSEYRLMGETLRKTALPVYLIAPHVFDKLPDVAAAGEDYFPVNREIAYERFGREFSYLALLAFSGRYDWRLTTLQNFDRSTIGLVETARLNSDLPLPMALLLGAQDSSLLPALRTRYQNATIHEENTINSLGETAFVLMTITPREP